MAFIESIDPFLMQLVIVPIIVIGLGILSSIMTKRGCSKSPVKMTHQISSLARFSVPHVSITYVPVLKTSPPRTSRSFLSSFLNTH